MAIVVATAAATINILMAFYNVAKDAVGLSKRKMRYAENLETYKDSLEWKRESLHRTRVGARRKADRFGTETVRLHSHWGERVDKTDAKVGQFLANCENAKSFRKRAQLGEKGSVLAKEVDRVEADGKIFYDPSYRSLHKAQPRFASGKDTTTMTSTASLTTRNSTYGSSSSSNSWNPSSRSFSTRNSRHSDGCSSSNNSWNTSSSTYSGSSSWNTGRSSSSSQHSTYSGSNNNNNSWNTSSSSFPSRNSTHSGSSSSRSYMPASRYTSSSGDTSELTSRLSKHSRGGSSAWSTTAVCGSPARDWRQYMSYQLLVSKLQQEEQKLYAYRFRQ